MSISCMLCLPGLVPVLSKRSQKMWFEVHPSFLRLVCSVPFTAVHHVKTSAFYQVFGDGHNLDVCIGVLKGHGFLSVLNLLHESFKLYVSADLALHSLVDFVYVLACEAPVFAVEVSKHSKACYSCVCRVFFIECAIVHFRN